MKWTAVEKELPKTRKGIFLLANFEQNVIKVMFLQKKWYSMTGNEVFPSHWMSLPEPPKVKAKKVVKAPAKKAVKKAAKKNSKR